MVNMRKFVIEHLQLPEFGLPNFYRGTCECGDAPYTSWQRDDVQQFFTRVHRHTAH